jgi:Collagen triple helix repeat (20 copies)
MQKKSWYGQRPAVLVVCVLAAFAGTATVLSVSVAATGAGTASGNKPKTKPNDHALTKAEVLSLIKRYSKSGSIGATGPAGTSGSAGPKGENGAKGEKGTTGETGEKGERGEKGEVGAKGEAGANGAVAGYSASQPPTGPGGGVAFTAGTETSPTAVLSKALPAGSYLASAKVQVSIGATEPGGEGSVDCALADVPSSGSPVVDVSGFFSTIAALVPVADVYGAETTLPLEVAVSSTSPSLLAVSCWVNLGEGGKSGSTAGTFFAEAADTAIQAVQTSANS